MKKLVKKYMVKITEVLKNENSKINKLLPFFILFLFVLLNTIIVFKLYFKNEKTSKVLRLHVVANSNSLEDQIIKLKVNEKITKYISKLNNENLENKGILENIKENIAEILNISDETIKNSNVNYTASANIGKIHYEKKESILLDMDAGNYNSVQIVLGEGNGKNIWSLISPSKENLKNISLLNTIMPGIDKLYESDTSKEFVEDAENKNYTFKIVEVLKDITNKE